MNVQNRLGKGFQQFRPNQAHEPCKADERHLSRTEFLRDRRVVVGSRGVGAVVKDEGLDPGITRALQAGGVSLVGNHDRNRRVERSVANRVDQRLQIAATTRDEDSESPGRGSRYAGSGFRIVITGHGTQHSSRRPQCGRSEPPLVRPRDRDRRLPDPPCSGRTRGSDRSPC